MIMPCLVSGHVMDRLTPTLFTVTASILTASALQITHQ